MSRALPAQAAVPSVDRLLNHPSLAQLIDDHGRQLVVEALRTELANVREQFSRSSAAPDEPDPALADPTRIAATVALALRSSAAASLRPVFNLTGVLLHTNLGRAVLPEIAIEAMAAAARQAVALEYDVDLGRRGERDRHLEPLVCRLTGAEKATAVNNNAAAVLLVLNTLALKREVILSRGELIEIGGEFRMPAIMKRAGCRLVEVGTTNRTHLRDYEEAIGSGTAMLMKVHTSNYEIRGFTKSVDEKALAELAHQHGLPLVSDLGSGTLADLRRWGLPHEPTAGELIAAGVDLVTFSGDKLLGGPQAGIIAGRRDLLEKINHNPLKRAVRLDKLRVAALEAVFRLYADPDRLAERLPVLMHMARPLADLETQARRLLPAVEQAFAGLARVSIEACECEAGSGSLPSDRLPSLALAVTPHPGRKRSSAAVEEIARACRALPVPVIGRIRDGALLFDLRCLDDEEGFLAQLSRLRQA